MSSRRSPATPASPQDEDEDRAVEDLLAARGWVITGQWTNDEWQQWVAPVRRQDTHLTEQAAAAADPAEPATRA
jgi:hypothetical protein